MTGPQRDPVFTVPDNPVQTLAAIAATVTRSWTGTRYVYEADQARREAASAYKRAYARAYLNAPGPIKDREQHAILACTSEQDAMDAAEAAYGYAQSKARTLRDQLDALRSCLASQREELRVAGAGQ